MGTWKQTMAELSTSHSLSCLLKHFWRNQYIQYYLVTSCVIHFTKLWKNTYLRNVKKVLNLERWKSNESSLPFLIKLEPVKFLIKKRINLKCGYWMCKGFSFLSFLFTRQSKKYFSYINCTLGTNRKKKFNVGFFNWRKIIWILNAGIGLLW